MALLLHRGLGPASGSRTVSHSNVFRYGHRKSTVGSFVRAGPTTPTPSYVDIDRQVINKVFMDLFRQKLALINGSDSPTPGYDGIIEMIKQLNSSNDPATTRRKARKLLQSLFPVFIPPAFKVMFAQPLPELSEQMNAVVTASTCQWLMGPSKVNDITLPTGEVKANHGVLVERCRFLEAAGCVSVCVNSCKIPTQEFFYKDMGIRCTMTPNYEDFSCQFSFGVTPLPTDLDDAFKSPCFAQCPSRKRHQDDSAEKQCPSAVP